MSSRIANFLLKRLRRQAARDALDLAISNRWLAEEGGEERDDEGGPRQVRVGNHFVEDDELRPERSTGRRLQLGSKLDGRPWTEIVRLLKRDGITLDVRTAGADHVPEMGAASKVLLRRAKRSSSRGSAPEDADGMLVADVVRAIRASAAPPPVDEIAVVLLLADGIARSGLSDDQGFCRKLFGNDGRGMKASCVWGVRHVQGPSFRPVGDPALRTLVPCLQSQPARSGRDDG